MRNWMRAGGRGLAMAVLGIALARAGDAPKLDEVLGLLREHARNIPAAEIEQAAVDGVLDRLRPRVLLLTNDLAAADAPETARLSRTNLIEERLGFLRVGRVAAGLAGEITGTLAGWQTGGRLEGAVIDLRFAAGDDFAEAGRVADLFVTDARPLLDWGRGSLGSTAKTNTLAAPVVLLVNAETAGAAEALAAIVQEARAGLVLGTNTAGRACEFQTFSLSTGQRLLIAGTPVKVGSGRDIPLTGVKPDVLLSITPEQEKLHWPDPFKAPATAPDDRNKAAATNRPPRLTEADLVRLHRAGQDTDGPEALEPPPATPSPDQTVIHDPALARGVDLLKGLAIVRARRP